MLEWRLARSVAVCAAFALVSMSVALVVVLRREETDAGAQLAEKLSTTSQEIVELYEAIDRVNGIAAAPCSPEFLDALRSIAFATGTIKDIAYRQNSGVLCGPDRDLTNSLQLPRRPAFVGSNGWKAFPHVPLDLAPGLAAAVLDTGRFLIIRKLFADAPPMDSEFEHLSKIRLADHHRLELAFGPDYGLTEEQLRGGKAVWRASGLVVPMCLSRGWACYTLGIEWPGMLWAHASWLIALAASGALAGALANALWFRWVAHRNSLDQRIRRAIDGREFVLHYQPICHAESGRYVSAEALLRWPQKGGGHIDPDDFIAAAESSGTIGALTRMVVALTLQDLGDFLRRQPDFSIALNISADDLVDPDFHAALDRHVAENRIRPQQITLEVTERTVVDSKRAIESTRHLRALGYAIHIDDFGTGYSNLAYLSDLSVHGVKIDRSFIRHIGAGSSRARIVSSILDIARDFGLHVTAEGVETDEQVRYLLDRGVKLMQGWRFAAAMPADLLVRACERLDAAAAVTWEPATI